MYQKTIHISPEDPLKIDLPKKFRGKTIQFFAFPVEEKMGPLAQKTFYTMGDFMGLLAHDKSNTLKTHTEKARTEWDRNI